MNHKSQLSILKSRFTRLAITSTERFLNQFPSFNYRTWITAKTERREVFQFRGSVESLEPRRLLAFSVTAFPGQIYEGGSNYNGINSLFSDSASIDFSGLPGEGAGGSIVVTITGPTDAYDIENALYAQPSTNERIVSLALSGDPYFIIRARGDADMENEDISIEATLSYTVFDYENNVVTNFGPFPDSASLLIIDNDFSSQLTLSASDSTALEPHSVFYQPELPIDVGLFQISVPDVWRGGAVLLQTSGTAQAGVDYGIDLFPAVPGALVTPVSANVFSLTIPSRANGGGSANISLRLTPFADENESEGTEQATLAWGPNQSIVSEVSIPEDYEYVPELTKQYHFSLTGSGNVLKLPTKS
jgi:hypothetical protein